MVSATLARLRKLALALPRPGYDWEDRPTFDVPPSAAEVTGFEAAAGFPLPADLRAFLADGGAVVGMSVHNGYHLGGLAQLIPAVESGDFPRNVEGMPAVVVGTDGGGNAFLLVADGRVCRWDREAAAATVVGTSFGTFLERVADDWAAFVAETPGWQFLV